MTDKTVALITGANKGLGLEIARQLGKRGMVVVLGSRDQTRGASAVAELAKAGIDAHAVKLDVTQAGDVARLPGFFAETFGRLDVLVNNAGISEGRSDDADSFRRVFDVNVFGAVAVTYALLPLLKQSPAGRIVNHSSVLGSLTTIQKKPEMFARFVSPSYTASKSALNGFTVALAHKTRGTALKVNSAHPGWVKTDMGGAEATLTVSESVNGMVAVINGLNPESTGKFYNYDGQILPW